MFEIQFVAQRKKQIIDKNEETRQPVQNSSADSILIKKFIIAVVSTYYILSVDDGTFSLLLRTF